MHMIARIPCLIITQVDCKFASFTLIRYEFRWIRANMTRGGTMSKRYSVHARISFYHACLEARVQDTTAESKPKQSE